MCPISLEETARGLKTDTAYGEPPTGRLLYFTETWCWPTNRGVYLTVYRPGFVFLIIFLNLKPLGVVMTTLGEPGPACVVSMVKCVRFPSK